MTVTARPAVLIHAGAGCFGAELVGEAAEVRRVLLAVLAEARSALQSGSDAVGVTIRCVERMEDCERFNAGRGSALCADGTVEMSAAVMRGADRGVGAVAGVRTIRNPVRAAEIVLAGEEVLMIGAPAEQRAIDQGAASLPNRAFVTDRQRARLAFGPGRDPQRGARGTVGAVCLDSRGNLAAATSTGGISGQPPGRIGDTPLIGAGTWADGRVAVSCTGDGEMFIRSGAAQRLAGLVAAGHPLADAGQATLTDVGRLGGRGGLIALDAEGHATLPFTTEAMPRGAWRAGQAPAVWIAEPE